LRDLVYAHVLPFIERVSGIYDDPIVGFQSLQDFKRCSKVSADCQLAKMRLVIRVYNHGAQTLRAEEEGVHRNLHSGSGDLHLQVHLSVAAREELGASVRYIHFRQECS
jgi:hypothetical protein